MFQEDYLIRQINQLARALGKLLFDFMGIKNTGLIEQYHQVADKILKEEIDYNLTELLDIPNDEFVTHLLRKDGFNNANLNLLADLFYEMGSALQKEVSVKYFEKLNSLVGSLSRKNNLFLSKLLNINCAHGSFSFRNFRKVSPVYWSFNGSNFRSFKWTV